MSEETIAKLNDFCDESLKQIIISNYKGDKDLKKAVIAPVRIKGELVFQESEYRGNQVFHKNLAKTELAERLAERMTEGFHQLELHSLRADAVLLVSKKGKETLKIKKKNESRGSEKNECGISASGEKVAAGISIPANELSHNRTKDYIIPEGTPVPFLVDLGVMTQEGKIVRTRYDKFRQINRFLEFIEDILPEFPEGKEISILDFGCGKSYLTFAMYYYLHICKGYPLRVTGLDLKTEVIRNCNELAKKYRYDTLHFEQGDIASYGDCDQIDMVVTLHACDTATDFALEKAVGWGAKVILSVPCCQHELNRTIKNEVMAPVLKYGLLKERMAALITDGLRADLLEQLGYKVQVLEFIDMEHTPKNILIRAVKKKQMVPAGLREKKLADYRKCLEEWNLNPTLYRDLFGDNAD